MTRGFPVSIGIIGVAVAVAVILVVVWALTTKER